MDAVKGLFLNIPSLEAKEDLRGILSVGSCFSDDGGKYIEHLQDTCWELEPETAEISKRLLAAASQKRGRVKSKPLSPEKPEEQADGNH